MATSKAESYNSYKMFKCFKRKFKITEAGPPADVRDAFSRFAGGSDHMSADQLRRFMEDHQGESGVTIPKAEVIIREVLRRRNDVAQDKTTTATVTTATTGLKLDDFFHLLFLDDFNGPFKSEVRFRNACWNYVVFGSRLCFFDYFPIIGTDCDV